MTRCVLTRFSSLPPACVPRGQHFASSPAVSPVHTRGRPVACTRELIPGHTRLSLPADPAKAASALRLVGFWKKMQQRSGARSAVGPSVLVVCRGGRAPAERGPTRHGRRVTMSRSGGLRAVRRRRGGLLPGLGVPLQTPEQERSLNAGAAWVTRPLSGRFRPPSFRHPVSRLASLQFHVAPGGELSGFPNYGSSPHPTPKQSPGQHSAGWGDTHLGTH